MKTKDIAFLSCRFFAIYMLYEGLSYFFGFVVSPSVFNNTNPDAAALGIVTGAMFIVSLLTFLLFWFKAEWVASKIVETYVVQEANAPANVEDIQNAGFAIVGMLILAKAIPLIANDVGMSFFDIGNHRLPPISYSIQLGAQFIMGVSLILGAKWCSKTIKKLRNW